MTELPLVLLVAVVATMATGQAPHVGATSPEAAVSSGRGGWPGGTLRSLVGTAAGGRAQCGGAGPCGRSLSGGVTPRLEATPVPCLGAALLATLCHPRATSRGDTGGTWATTDLTTRVTNTFDATTGVTNTNGATTDVTGVPELGLVEELLVALEPNYRSAGGQEGCLEAAGVLEGSAGGSPRGGSRRSQRLLALLGALVLRGRCLTPPERPPCPPPCRQRGIGPLGGAGQGLSPPMEQLGPDPPEEPPLDALPPPQSQPRDRFPPELLQAPGFPGGGTTPPHRHGPTAASPTATSASPTAASPTATSASPTATGPTATSAGPTATGPTATSAGPTATGQLSVAERYALGSVAGLVLTLSPLVALALLRCPPCPHAQRWLRPPMLGVAAGALSGDALLHLLPQLLGVHSHGEGSQPHGEGSQPHMGGSELPWPLLGVLGGLYVAFLLEKLLSILLAPPRHEGDLAVGQQQQPGGQEDVGQQLGASTTELVKMENGVLPQSGQELQSQAPPTLPWMVTLGHGAHGLADGLALGAAFATSGASGVATGLALLCHELPHALGELAVLAQAGVPWRRGLALGLGGALPVLPGVYVGLALGGTATARAWLGALATGLLLHLALCDMVPAMLSWGEGPPWAVLGLQSLGLLGGWGGLLLLALYEDSILL